MSERKSGRELPPGIRLARRFLFEILFAVLVVVLFADYLFSSKLLYGSDSIPAGLFFRTLLVDFVKQFHELPKWNPYILGGLPFLDATHGDTFFPTSILHFLFPVYRALGHKLLVHIVLAGVFMMFYLRTLRLAPSAVVFGGLAYMLCPVFVSYLFAGQDGKMYVTSLTPLVVGLLERAMRSGSVRTFLGLGLAIGLTILSAQIQMAYHMLWLVGALFVARLVKGPATGEPGPPRAKSAVLFVASIAIALLVAAVQLMPAVSYVKDPRGFSVRSTKTDYEHATSWSLHPEEIASMVVPEFCNAPRGYWGRNIFKYNSDAVGILTLALAALALARRRDATRVFYAAAAALFVAYSLGGHTPVHRLFYAVVPQVKLFRAPPLVMFLAAFSFVVLAAHAVHDLAEGGLGQDGRRERGRRAGGASRFAMIGLAAAGAILLLGLAAGGFTSFWNDLLAPPLDEAKLAAQRSNLPVFRLGAVFVAIVLAGGVVTIEAWRRGKLSARAAVAVLCALTIADLWRVDRRFKMVVDEAQFLSPDPLVSAVRDPASAGKYRVMPVNERYATNELGFFGIESVYGFHDNELAWYRELRTAPEVEGFLKANEQGYPFLRVLNVKYILHDRPDAPNPYELPGFLPRFWVVDQYEVIEDRARIAARIAEGSFDPARRVILEEAPSFASVDSAGEAGQVTGYAYRGNGIDVSVEALSPCLLLHSENWFPYWKAYAEGAGGERRELPILRANGTIRAIPLAAGTHAIQLRYRSGPYERGKWITLGTVGACLIGILLPLRRGVHRA